jgi:hypothetical protein
VPAATQDLNLDTLLAGLPAPVADDETPPSMS